ncbi:MAG: pirin-like C-terminal cupin domain-containing protein [Gemmatimonadaceae bacterium]
MTASRNVARVDTVPLPTPGFIGEGHTAAMVVDPKDFARNDPFIALMDDHIDLAEGRTAGGAHPHAGFETVTLVLEGEVRDRDEGTLHTGDALWMTAGSGVIHNEEVVPHGYTRILQLWLTLPHEHRWAAPRFEHVVAANLPVRREPGVEARVYSGTSGSATAPTHNYVPVILLDVKLDAGAAFTQELPASYNGLVYVLSGEVELGPEHTRVASGQVAWLANATELSQLRIAAGDAGARVLLYAGERTNVPIVMHGPFVGETRDDLMRVSRQFMEGKLPRLSELP